ncbi:MAG: hypothetical protein CSA39_03065 [Flavobacteriales bacterium]|nr:MAG: hypothetical protein CSA39_03065 [Flavobacteriales bacterium]
MTKIKNLDETIKKYYPYGINFLNSKLNINTDYQNSVESIRLQKLITKHNKEPLNKILLIINNVKQSHNIDLINNSHFTMGDRAYNLQFNEFFKDNKFYPICFVISLIAPYYFSYIIDIDIDQKNPVIHNGYKWENHNGRNKKLESDKNYKKIIDKVSKEIELTLSYEKFPENLINTIIPNISYQNIEMGKFTYFNALFLNDFYCTG